MPDKDNTLKVLPAPEARSLRARGGPAVQIRGRAVRGTGTGRADEERPRGEVPEEGAGGRSPPSGRGHCAHSGRAQMDES